MCHWRASHHSCRVLGPGLLLVWHLIWIITQCSQPSSNPTTSKSPAVPPIDGVIGSISKAPIKTSCKQKSISNTTPNSSSQNPLGPGKTSKVHIVQSTAVEKSSKVKKKCKGKAKANAPEQCPPKLSAGESSQQKSKYLFLICEEDHYTKVFPWLSEVSWLLKWTPAVL